MRRYSYLICFLIFGLIFTGTVVSAAVIKVPDDYSTIQAAVDEASPGDKIQVAPDTYYENKLTANKSLSVIGENKADTILDVGGNQYGFYSTTDSIYISGFQITNYTSHAVNFQDGSTSIISNNIFDPGSPAISAIQAFSSVSEVEVTSNEMYGVGVAAYTGSCNNWTITNNSINIENNPHHGIVGGGSNYIIEYNDIKNSGDPSDGGNHQAIDTYQFGSASDWKIQFNNIYDNEDGIQIEGTGHEIHYNSIHDNTAIGVSGDSTIDATLNWWGDPIGPSGKGDGSGDAVSEDVIYSPWLGINPDDDPNTVGVQLRSPLTFIVAEAGPPSAEGYLDTAIMASNDQTNFPGLDTIIVNEGTYNTSQPITDGVEIISETGPITDFVLNGNLSVETSGIIMGGPGRGLTVNDDISIDSGVTGAGVLAKIRRNNLEGTLIHSGDGSVDVLFNYWHGSRPTTKVTGNSSEVIFSPWLDKLPGITPMTYVVDDVGKNPPDGYLYTAFAAATDKDTIEILTDERQDDYSTVSGLVIDEQVTIPSGESGSGLTYHHNTITGILAHNGNGLVDASSNYWGANGPQDNLSGNIPSVIYSPWLAAAPNRTPTTYIVDDVGAEPEGSLQRAIIDANTDPDRDKITVNTGDYSVSPDKPATYPVEIVSTTGCPADACIHGELSLEAEEVLLGRREELTNTNKGFTINADVTVASEVDASSIQINWNNIYGTVANNGNGTLNAEYNWWGDTNPDDSTVGAVDFTPYLPADVCSVLEYMEENGITNPEDAVAGMITGDASSSERAIAQLTTMGFDPDEAGEILDEFGLGRVFAAMNGARDSRQFIKLLGGYSLPAGAAGGLTNNIVAGGAGSVGGKTVGAVFEICEPVKVSFPLANFEGNPATDLHPTVSLVRLNKGGEEVNLEKVTTATYKKGDRAYVITFDSCELNPGYYEIQIDLPVLTSLSQVVKLEEKGSGA